MRPALRFLPLNGFVAAALLLAPLPAQEISFERELLIDANEHDLSAVGFVAPFADGTIVVYQHQDARLLFFDRNGRQIARAGRSGGGPGEFGLLGGPMFVADTLAVAEPGQGRYHLFDNRGRFLRTVRIPDLIVPGHGALPGLKILWGVAPAGMAVRVSLYGPVPAPWRSQIGPTAAGHPVMVFADSRGEVRHLTAVESPHQQICTHVPSLQIECLRTRYDYGRDARTYASVDQTIRNAGSAFITVKALRSNGDTIFVRRITITPEPLTQRFVDSIRAGAGASRQTAEFRKWLEPVKRILVSSDDAVWIGFRPDASGRRWLILNRDGSTRGTLALPPNLRISDASATHFWGTMADEDGLDHPVRYRIERAGIQ